MIGLFTAGLLFMAAGGGCPSCLDPNVAGFGETCTQKSDCGDGEYCSDGLCYTFGQ